MTQGENKKLNASEKLTAAATLLSRHSADQRTVMPGVRSDLAIVARIIREENEKLGGIIKQGKRQVGGMQAKIMEQARIIRGLERRLEELEGSK